jgi:hypothetical protein
MRFSMAVKKNYQKVKKKYQPKPKKSKRGRPKLPFYVKWQRFLLDKIKKNKKKIKEKRKKLNKQFFCLATFFGIKKGRGRPKLGPKEKV